MRRLVLAVAALLALAPAALAYPTAPPSPSTGTVHVRYAALADGTPQPVVTFTGTLAPQAPYQTLACRRTSNRTYCSWVYHVQTVEASCAWCYVPPSSVTIGGYYGRTYAQCSGGSTSPDSLNLLETCAWGALHEGVPTLHAGDYIDYSTEVTGSGSMLVTVGGVLVAETDIP